MSVSATATQPPSSASTTTSQYNLPPYWDNIWANFKSNWTFPPPVDTKLLQDFRYSKYFNGSTTYLQWGAQNFTRPSSGKFGAERAVVHVGDIIEVDWIQIKPGSPKDSEPRTVKMSCSICPTGAVNGNIFLACGGCKSMQFSQPITQFL